MKNLLLFTVLFGLAQTNVLASSEKTFQEEENNFKKSQTFTQDEIRFDHLEKEFRAKYGHLNIPPIRMVDDLAAQHGWAGAGYIWTNHELLVDKKTMNELPASSWQWIMLHETGHAQMRYVVPTIQAASCTNLILTPYFWGMHKKVPYKNIVTKAGSKFIATYAIGALLNINGFRAEEGRADNFANKHADQNILNGGKKFWEDHKNMITKVWNQSGNFQVMPLLVFQNLTDPLHPTIDSRIAKIQKALKNRFGSQA